MAVIGAAGVAPAALAAIPVRRTRTTRRKATEPVVAYVSQADSDEVSLMVGEREVVVCDRDLVARILEAAGE